MRLTRFTDYTLRTLTYLASHPGHFVTIAEIAGTFRISANHLMKVVQHLAAEGDIVTMRGQHGGLRLARPADTIRLGEVVRRAEPDMDLLPALDHTADEVLPNGYLIASIVERARDAFLAVLDGHTVADLVSHPQMLAPFLERAPEHVGFDPR